MIAGYARHCAIDADPAEQERALKAAGCQRIFSDRPGRTWNRPELKAMLATLQKGDTLVVWKLSRLAGSLKRVLELTSELEERGVSLRVLDANIDTATNEGRLFFQMATAINTFEREITLEKVHAEA